MLNNTLFSIKPVGNASMRCMQLKFRYYSQKSKSKSQSKKSIYFILFRVCLHTHMNAKNAKIYKLHSKDYLGRGSAIKKVFKI
jgi:hypothetical protein